jgi:5-methylcytosine-specific restriction endonuclease McrA
LLAIFVLIAANLEQQKKTGKALCGRGMSRRVYQYGHSTRMSLSARTIPRASRVSNDRSHHRGTVMISDREKMRQKKYRDTHKEFLRELSKKYRKNNPDKIRANHAAWRSNNRELCAQRVKDWQKRNPEYGRQKTRKRRAIKKGQHDNFTRYEWDLLCKQYDYKCLKCMQQKPLTADHVVPLSWGGSDSIDNIQPLCQSCNSSKNDSYVDYRTREPVKVTQLSFFTNA